MGYPMTWERLKHRNGLDTGGYDTAPERHRIQFNLDAFEQLPHEYVKERLSRYESAFRNLAGDLRRLEQDTVDENALVLLIAKRTGIDEDSVAAVLKEFINV